MEDFSSSSYLFDNSNEPDEQRVRSELYHLKGAVDRVHALAGDFYICTEAWLIVDEMILISRLFFGIYYIYRVDTH